MVRPWPLLVLLALAPTALAQEGDPLCIIFVEPDESFEKVRIFADLILDDAERSSIAAEIDADASGNITEAEVDAYETAKRETMTSVSSMGSRILYLDGNSPRELVVTVELRNWTGPIETAKMGLVREHRVYDFGFQPYDYEHALSGGIGAHPYRIPKPVVEVVVINAPGGWLVTSVGQARNGTEGPTAPTYAGDGNLFRGQQQSVTLEGFDLHSSFVMTFRDESPTYPKGSPGVAAPLVLATLAILALIARRR